MTLGQKIKQLRKQANLSLRELEKKVDANFTYLSKIENDRTDDRPPSEDLLKRIAKELNTDADELLRLAQRIPNDVKKYLLKNKETLEFLRSAIDKNVSTESWNDLIKKMDASKKNEKQ